MVYRGNLTQMTVPNAEMFNYTRVGTCRRICQLRFGRCSPSVATYRCRTTSNRLYCIVMDGVVHTLEHHPLSHSHSHQSRTCNHFQAVSQRVQPCVKSDTFEITVESGSPTSWSFRHRLFISVSPAPKSCHVRQLEPNHKEHAP